MKKIIAITKDGSSVTWKKVADDYDVETWREKRKHLFDQLGIVSIKVEQTDN